MQTNLEDGDDERSPWTRPSFLASAAIVALIVILGLALVVTGPNEPAAGPPADAVADEAAPSTRPTGAAASVCGLPGRSAPVSRAPDTSWELAGTMAVPAAPRSVGPGVVENGLRSCFSHAPVGALYAAVNAIAMTGSDQQRGPFIRRYVAAGLGRKRALAVLEQTPSNEGSDTVLQIAGFQVVDYSTSSAVIDLALRVVRGDRTGLVHVPVALRWQQGDWRLAVPDTGLPFDAMAPITSLADYIAWSGA